MTLFLDENCSGSVGRVLDWGSKGSLNVVQELPPVESLFLCPWARHYLVHGYMGAVSGAGVYFVSNPELLVEM